MLGIGCKKSTEDTIIFLISNNLAKLVKIFRVLARFSIWISFVQGSIEFK